MRTMSVCIAILAAFCGMPSAGAGDLAAMFAEAQPEFSPVPIWWWSGDRIEREGIAEQLRRMAVGGIHNAIILNLAPSGPLYGSAADEPPFLSDEWWDLFGFALQEAKKSDIRLWFYDQLGFSGAGLQARVVRDHPECRGVNLERIVKDVEGPASVELSVPPSGTALAAFMAERLPREARVEEAQWIWAPNTPEGKVKRYFRRVFALESPPRNAVINISCDNGYVLFVNGEKLGEESIFGEQGWGRAERFEVSSHLRTGENVLAIEAENLAGIGGLIVEVLWDDEDGRRALVSDDTFRVLDQPADGWTESGFDDSAWRAAEVIGPMAKSPWPSVQGMQTTADVILGDPIRNVEEITRLLKDGTLTLDVPPGAHRVQIFYTTPGGFDYQNPAACAALLDVVHGEMERRFPEELGKGIAGSFQDEFPALPRYSTRMRDEFLARKGYDILKRLPALYDDVVDRFGEKRSPDTIQIRCDANDVAAALNEEAFFIPLHQWHERFGMLCGYDQTVRNADPIRGEAYYVDYFRTQRHYSAPGNDMDGDAKPHQSIADLYQRPRVWCEAFHSSGWGQTMEEIAVLLHPWLATGSTLFNPHAIYYSVHGSYYEWAPPDTGWRQPYFVHYKTLADYVSRLCQVLAQGSHVVSVGVLHPAQTVHAYAGFGGSRGPAQQASQTYWAVQDSLRAARVDYIVVDEDSIERMGVKNGGLDLGNLRLNSIIMPGTRVLKLGSIRKLAEFAADGGQVVIVGAAPEHSADGNEGTFAEQVQRLTAHAVRTEDTSETAGIVQAVAPRNTVEPVITLHRQIAERDFFLALSDDQTPATGNARFDINRRELYATAAAKGERWPVTFRTDGIPEFWDALAGEVRPILNYKREGGNTRVDIDLGTTPAPLIGFRPAGKSEPLAIESELDIQSITRDGMAVRARGIVRPESQAKEAAIRVTYEDAQFEARAAVAPAVRIPVDGPLPCRLEPTSDNWDGSFAWPPSAGAIPVEVRAFKYKAEQRGEDSGAWAAPDFSADGWSDVIASFGPRAMMSQVTAQTGGDFEAIKEVPEDLGELRPAVYSLKLGIDEDPVFSSALGGKGRIPEEFIDFGEVVEGDVYAVRAMVTVPEDAGGKGLEAILRVGGSARKRAFLNGKEVLFVEPINARTRQGEVVLRPGKNRIEILAARENAGRLRLFYHFLPKGSGVHAPEWIWSAAPSGTAKSRFSKTIEIPGKVKHAVMVVALGDLHQIRINGNLVADQGNFDPYFTSRAERYDISNAIVQGANIIEIAARDEGPPTGLMVDGVVELDNGEEITFVSDATWQAVPDGGEGGVAFARILPGPAHGYMGDPACLLLRPRQHPLPYAGWLLNEPAPPAPFDRIVSATGIEPPAAGWYRFRLPPGAVKMHFKTPGEARLFVNGGPVQVQADEAGLTAALPQPDAPERIAALRITQAPGFEEGAAILEPITFEVGDGRIPFGSWDELGLPHYAGGLLYTASIGLHVEPGKRVELDLGRVRGCADVSVNGKACGVRIWHPYRFDITKAVQEGENTIEMRVYNTLGPHFAVGHPSHHVFEGHTKSGIFGPVAVVTSSVCEMELKPI